ncbi:MAG: type II toxin-antitoxin system Phd/YefM family antitoxin [Melioribacteraceae bacterium]
MILTASALRKNIYKMLDKVLETGIPIEIERKGKKLKIISTAENQKLSNLKKRNIFIDSPQSIVHIDWSSEWKM